MEIIKETRLHIALTVSTLDQFTYFPSKSWQIEHLIFFDLCFSFSTSFVDRTQSNSFV